MNECIAGRFSAGTQVHMIKCSVFFSSALFGFTLGFFVGYDIFAMYTVGIQSKQFTGIIVYVRGCACTLFGRWADVIFQAYVPHQLFTITENATSFSNSNYKFDKFNFKNSIDKRQ